MQKSPAQCMGGRTGREYLECCDRKMNVYTYHGERVQDSGKTSTGLWVEALTLKRAQPVTGRENGCRRNMNAPMGLISLTR